MHVAVLGGGYAGVSTARRVADRLPADAELTLVNDGPDHLVRHEVHRVIRRPELAETITVPLAEAVPAADVRPAAVESFDAETGAVTLANGDSFAYDYGAVAFGSDTAYYGIEGLPANATPLKSVADAQTIRETALAAIEAGRETDDPPRIAVCGAGLSGIQTAGELAALAREEGAGVPTDLRVALIEQANTVAPNFPPNFQRAVHDALAERGVEIETNTTVTAVRSDAVETDRGPVSVTTDTPGPGVVWTGGITGTAAAGGQRPSVRADLRLTDRTLALGDAARVLDNHGEPVPASAAAAIREGKVAGRNLARLATADGPGRPRLDRYTFDVPGWLVSVGDGAVAQLGPTVLTGTSAVAAKATVGAGYLTGVGAIREAVDLVQAELPTPG